MIKGFRYFCFLLLCISITPSYAQFYDIKQEKRLFNVTTRRESTSIVVNSNITNGVLPIELSEEISSLVQSDTLSSTPLLCVPLDTLIITSSYGYRIDPFTEKRKFHYGTDFQTYSYNVYAMMPGRVHRIGYNKTLGNYIELDHGDFRVTYAHLHTVIGEKNDYVRAGQSVGITGNTGRSTGEHLHLSIKYKDKSIDPYPIVRFIYNWRKQFASDLDDVISLLEKK